MTENLEIENKIEHIVIEFPSYGYRRVTKQLHRQGNIVNSKKDYEREQPRLQKKEI